MSRKHSARPAGSRSAPSASKRRPKSGAVVENGQKGFFVSFDYSTDALSEIDQFFKRSHKVIVPLTVDDILNEQLARKLA